MIIKSEGQFKLEFGKGDICIAGGYTTGDKIEGFVVFEDQETREIGSPGTIKKGEIDLNDFDVVMTFSKKKSIDALIGQLELVKTYMDYKEECSCHRLGKSQKTGIKCSNCGREL